MHLNYFKIITLVLFTVLSSSGMNAQVHWESMVLESDTW